MEKSLQINVSGRVQGVGFRYYTQKAARARGLKGFVKNLANGDVYIEVQGLQDQLTAFSEEVKRGPILARVDKMLVNELILQEFSHFEVR
jgi:acylphosphatase